MSGRWGGRRSTKAGTRDLAMDTQDASPGTIAKVRALYDRPGTPGEKAAAASALRRMGIEPEIIKSASSGFSNAKSGGSRLKQYKVTVIYSTNVGNRNEDILVDAVDEIDAERKARDLIKKKYAVGDIVARARRA